MMTLLNRENFNSSIYTFYYAIPLIVWFAISVVAALGAVVICNWYNGTPWSIEFFWGLVKITCGV